MKKHTSNLKRQKGITLVALIITIIVMLILVAVSISIVINSGLIGKAKDAADQTKTKYAEEANYGEVLNINGKLYASPQDYVENKELLSGGILKVSENKNKTFDTNQELVDDYGNKITVPAGFKITSDSPNSVTGGIVIEDVDAGTTATAGSQFVWIAVEDVYTDTNGTKTNIELCRCGFDENGQKVSVEDGYEYQLTVARANMPNGMPDVAKDSQINYYRAFTFAEEETSREGSSTQNATAKNLRNFLSNASKGYYIGRYEARTTVQRTTTGDATTIVTEKIEDPVYNYVTQLQASERSRNMYASENFESDLVNSYAWDTAILFLQEFDDRADKSIKYSLQTSLNNSVSQTGTTTDKICNIYDMASNCYEWTTETAINNTNSASIPCVERGKRIQL